MSSLFSTTFKAMGSPCELNLYCRNDSDFQNICYQVKQKIRVLEEKYSRFLPHSLVTTINKNAGKQPTSIDQETFALLQYAQQCYLESDGLFDITSGSLRNIWNFHINNKNKLDSHQLSHLQKQIDKQLKCINWQKVQWDQSHIYLPIKGMEIDFGGIVKEYAADTIRELCRQQGYEYGYVNMGGDLSIMGPSPDNQPWPVAIQHPEKKDKIIGKFRLRYGSIASSGDYERYIEINGRRYSHIINPQSGWPVRCALHAVSVAAEHCIIAGSIATISMLKAEDGLDWLKQSGVAFICYDRKGQIHSNTNHHGESGSSLATGQA